ncbi:hypothetical protein C8A06_0337 [Microbacteriaceae bacterium MWH-Ta3]|nr:hypothetical protein C8A06_0337 [Microbacteriaceae bacterium MWH-Ta3]
MKKFRARKLITVALVVAVPTMGLVGCVPDLPLDCEVRVMSPDAQIGAEVAIITAPSSSFVHFEDAIVAAEPMLTELISSDSTEITTVLADGRPRQFSRNYTNFEGALTENDREDQLANAYSNIRRLYRCVSEGQSADFTVQPGSDILASLRVAADALDTDSVKRDVVIIGNGLQIGGQLPLESLGFPNSMKQVSEYVNDLYEAGALPDLNGITVSFVGLGLVDGTVQPSLNQQSHDVLEALWQELVTRSGGQIGDTIGDFPAEAPAPNSIDVSPVPTLDNACLFTIGEADGYQFKPDSAVFVNEKLARTAAEKLKDNLEGADCTSPLNVTGYTASGVNRSDYVAGNAKEMALSLNRAKAFKALMMAVGITNKIAVTGGGKGPFSDWAADGTFDEQLGKRNRIVEISEQ